MRSVAFLVVLSLALPAVATSAPLTADEAVKIALQKNSSIIQAEASVLSARSGLWSAYSGLVPEVRGSYSWNRTTTLPGDAIRTQQNPFSGGKVFTRTLSSEETDIAPGVNGSWSIINLQNWSNVSAARHGMAGAELNRKATRNDIALDARRVFYGVVRAMRLAEVAAGSLKLSRDDERRVRALFEVGSVSKSDLLKAKVRTAQSQLDSLISNHNVTNARINLARVLGLSESDVHEVDTTLVQPHRNFDPIRVLTEARASRPDLLAAEHELKSAQAGLNAARWQRLPSVALGGNYDFKSTRHPKSKTEFFTDATGTTQSGPTVISDFESKSDPARGVSFSVNVPLFDGFVTDARIASARATLLRSREARGALLRNLDGEVRLALLSYQESVEREALSRQALESAAENLNLVQQKYNVGSATILDLIDSQVQLQRAQSDLVSALADIRIAEAAVDRVRGAGDSEERAHP